MKQSAASNRRFGKSQKLLALKKYVDLTHEFAPGIPRWLGFPDETRKTTYLLTTSARTRWDRAFSRNCSRSWANGERHVDPPAHFIKGLRTFDQMVINAAEKSAPVG